MSFIGVLQVNNVPTTLPFPFFRAIIIVVMVIVSRVLKWVIPALLIFISLAWTPLIATHLSDGEVLRTLGGETLTLTELMISIGKNIFIAFICFAIGEILIRLNERFTRSTMALMGKDIDRM